MEPQKTSNSQSNLRKKNKAGGSTSPDFKIQNCSNQNSMVLSQKQTQINRTEQKTKNKLTIIWSTNLQQSRKEYPMEKT